MKKTFKTISIIILIAFISNVIGEDAARAWSVAEPANIVMPPAGMLLPSSSAYSLPTLKAISINPKDPFKIDFVVDTANQSLSQPEGQEQVNLLIKYFLGFLTIPEEELWVNLSPYEKDRIITPDFETTNAGRDMLAQDYILKQLASSLTYPDHELGKQFWKTIYNRARAQYGRTDIPINTFSKVWVVPDKANVYEENGSAFIGDSRLKVLTEVDYLSLQKHQQPPKEDINALSSQITRQIIIPELEREVNEGKYFAPLRQMYNSLILAIWFKERFKENLIGQVYVNQKKTGGITVAEKRIKEKIYALYLKAFKKGVYNYIKEEPDIMTGETIPRKYFSGGFSLQGTRARMQYHLANALNHMRKKISVLKLSSLTLELMPQGGVTKAELWALMKKHLLGADFASVASTDKRSLPHGYTFSPSFKGSINFAKNISNAASKRVVHEKFGDIRDIIHNEKKMAELIAFVSANEKELIIALEQYFINRGKIKADAVKLSSQAALNLEGALSLLAQEPMTEAYLASIYGPNSAWKIQNLKSAKSDFFNLELKDQIRYLIDDADSSSRVLPDELINAGFDPALVLEAAVKSGYTFPGIVGYVQAIKDIKLRRTVKRMIYSTDWFENAKKNAGVLRTADLIEKGILEQGSSAQGEIYFPSLEEKGFLTGLVAGLKDELRKATLITAQLLSVSNIFEVGASLAPASPSQEPPGQVFRAPEDQTYHLSLTNFTTTPVENTVAANVSGYVTNLDGSLYHKAGEPLAYIANPDVDSDIGTHSTNLITAMNLYTDEQSVIPQQGTTTYQLANAQEGLYTTLVDLAKDYQKKTAGVVTVPDDVSLPDSQNILVNNGDFVNVKSDLFKFMDHNRVSVVINLPFTVSINKFENIKINGESIVAGIENAEWKIDPSGKSSQVTLILNLTHPLPDGHNTLTADIIPAHQDYTDLTNVVGQVEAVSAVSSVREIPVISPGIGAARLLVYPGQVVQTNQPIIQIINPYYDQELQYILAAANAVNQEIETAKDKKTGYLTVSRIEWNRLNNLSGALEKERVRVQGIIDHLQIHSPGSGLFNGFNFQKGVVTNGENISLVGDGTAFIGDMNIFTNALLVSTNFAINTNDPVVVKVEPGGICFPGKVINKGVISSASRDVTGYHALQVMVFDPFHQNIFQTNRPVTVIFPKKGQEEKIASTALADAESRVNVTVIPNKQSSQSTTSSNAQPASVVNLNMVAAFLDQLPKPSSEAGATNQMDLNKVEVLVTGNPDLVAGNNITIQQKKEEADLVDQRKISITPGVYLQGGQLKWSVAAQAFFNGLLAGVQTGSAISAATPFVVEISGDIIRFFTHRESLSTKDKKLQLKMVKIFVYAAQKNLYHQVNQGQNLLIDVGSTEEKIARLNKQLDYLRKAQSEINARVSAHLIPATDAFPFERKIQEIASQITQLQIQNKLAQFNFNFFIGQSTNPQPIATSLPWGGAYGKIDKTGLLATLFSTNSQNPSILGMRATGEAVEKAIELQSLDQWFSGNLTGMFLNNGIGYSPVYNTSPNQNVVNSSQVKQGATVGQQEEIIVYDSGKNDEKAIAEQEQEKFKVAEKTTHDELFTTVSSIESTINILSQRISDLELAYQSATNNLDLMIRNVNGSYTQADMNAAIDNVNYLSQQEIDLKAQYLKAKAVLRELRLIGPEASTENNLNINFQLDFQNFVANSVSGGLAEFSSFPMAVYTNAFAFNFQAVTNHAPLNLSYSLSPGNAYYSVEPEDRAEALALMSGNSLEKLKWILIHEQNIENASNFLKVFITQFSGNEEVYVKAAREIILNSQNPSTVGDLLRLMGATEDHGLRFYLQIYQEALADNKPDVVNASTALLKNIALVYPEYFTSLTPESFENNPAGAFPLVSSVNANRIFFTIASEEKLPKSLFTTLLLRSGMYTSENLHQIYAALRDFNKNPQLLASDKLKIQALLDAIKNAIVKIDAEGQIPETYRLGLYDHLGTGFLDIQSSRVEAVYAKNLSLAAADLLNGPESFTTNGLADLNTDLLKKAVNYATNALAGPGDWSKPLLPSDLPIFLRSETQVNSSAILIENYKSSLGTDGRISFIAELNKSDVNVLISLLQLEGLREGSEPLNDKLSSLNQIFNLLMSTPQGRLAIAELYSNAPRHLQEYIEALDWLKTIWGDVQITNDDPGKASKQYIWRTFLIKIWQNTPENKRQDWPQYAAWATVSDDQLHHDASYFHFPADWEGIRKSVMDVRAFLLAEGAANDYFVTTVETLIAQTSLETPDVTIKIPDFKHDATNNLNPDVFEQDFQTALKTAPKGKLRNYLNYVNDSMKAIKLKFDKDEQEIPWVPKLYVLLVSLIVAMIALPYIYSLLDWIKRIILRKGKNKLRMMRYIEGILVKNASEIKSDGPDTAMTTDTKNPSSVKRIVSNVVAGIGGVVGGTFGAFLGFGINGVVGGAIGGAVGVMIGTGFGAIVRKFVQTVKDFVGDVQNAVIGPKGKFLTFDFDKPDRLFSNAQFLEWYDIVQKLSRPDVTVAQMRDYAKRLVEISNSIFDGHNPEFSMPPSLGLLEPRDDFASNNIRFQKNLFYYIRISMYTQYLFEEQLRRKIATSNSADREGLEENIGILRRHLGADVIPYSEFLSRVALLHLGNARRFASVHSLEDPKPYFWSWSLRRGFRRKSWFEESRTSVLFQKMIEQSNERILEILPDLIASCANDFKLYSGQVPEDLFNATRQPGNPNYGRNILKELIEGPDPILERIPEKPGYVRYLPGKNWPSRLAVKEWYRIEAMLRDKQRIIDEAKAKLKKINEKAVGAGNAQTYKSATWQTFGQFFRELKYRFELYLQYSLIVDGVLNGDPTVIINPTMLFSDIWLIWSLYAYRVPNVISMSRVWVKELIALLLGPDGFESDFEEIFNPYRSARVNLFPSGAAAAVDDDALLSAQSKENDHASFSSALPIAVARRGGIDFSSMRSQERIRRSGSGSLLTSFRGFEFHVIQYQPKVNPVKLFLGTSENNAGSWFAARVGE